MWNQRSVSTFKQKVSEEDSTFMCAGRLIDLIQLSIIFEKSAEVSVLRRVSHRMRYICCLGVMPNVRVCEQAGWGHWDVQYNAHK